MNPDFSHRSTEIELMDDLESSGPVIPQTLRELNTINTWLGGDHVTINALKKLTSTIPGNQPLEILDIGCGGGDMLKKICRWARHTRRTISLTGIDANPSIIDYARQHTRQYPEIHYETDNILSKEFRDRQCDILTATLFTHHFTTSQLIDLFRQFHAQAKIGVVINDLHRHWFAFHSIKVLTRLFSRSEMVRNDASLSVLRSFTRKELDEILKASGCENYSLKWFWAFRWQVIIPA